MKNKLLRNYVFIIFFRKFSSFRILIKIYLNLILNKFLVNKKFPKLFYAGAKKGNLGGPLVKIQKLNKYFPEKKYNFNIVYSLSNSPLITSRSISALKKQKIPIILNQNGVFYPAWYKNNWEKQNLINSKVYHSADYVFWQSNFCKVASDKFLGKRFGDGEILYNAIDTKKFYPKEKKSKKIFKLLITGNINKQNNYRIKVVLKALKDIIKINNYVHLTIAGYIEDLNFLINLSHKLGINNYVTFIGSYSQEKAPKIYQNADAYITLSYQDNCPSAVIEAMSSGLPILYSHSGGLPEIVGEKSGIGLEVPQDWENIHIPDIKKIVLGVLEIMDNSQEISQYARERAVKFFDISYWIERHENLFKKFLEK